MQPIPQSIAEEIIDALQPFMDQHVAIDPFTLQRYKRELYRHINADPTHSYVALGMVSVLEWDLDGVHKNYRQALQLRNDALIHMNYGVSLQLLGQWQDAVRAAETASNMQPTNLSFLSSATSYAYNSGDFQKAVELRKLYDQRSPQEPYDVQGGVDDAYQIIQSKQVNSDLIMQCHSTAFELLFESKVPFISTQVIVDLSDESIMYFVRVDASDDEVDALDRELGARLFEIEDFHPAIYWVGYNYRETMK